MPSNTSGLLARNRRPSPCFWSPNIAGASRKNANTPNRNQRTQYSAPYTPGVSGGRERGEAQADQPAAVHHDTAGWSPRNRRSDGQAHARVVRRALHVAVAIPMAKKSTQFGAQMVATRSHDGSAMRK